MKNILKGRAEQRDRIIQYKQTFGTPAGRAVLLDLMNKFHIVNAHDGQPMREGERKVVLWIMNQTQIDVKAFDDLVRGEDSE